MAQTVVKLSPSMVKKIKQNLMQISNVQLLSTTNTYEAFRAKIGDGLIVGYTSGKIVANGSYETDLLTKIVAELETKAAEYDVMIGSDEAGKGEWLGPLTIAAVALTPREASELRAKGVMDSKELGLEKITALGSHIKVNSSGYYIVTISPHRFNEFWKRMKEEGKTLNDMLAWAHAKAIDQTYFELLRRKIIRENTRVQVVIDEFDRLKTEEQLRHVLDLRKIKLIQMPRAEEYVAVAAASILARKAREDWINRESRRMDLELRDLDVEDVMRLQERDYIAKVGYLNRVAR